jgi:flap endonuclease-1
MIDESIELLKAFGLPVVMAPSEAEAQASYMVKKGDAYAVATQDSDTLMFGATKIIRNLSIAGKRKKTKKLSFEVFKPELVNLSENLNNLGIDRDSLIALCMLIGTDFNVGGIKGLGPKKSIKMVKESKGDFDKLFSDAKWDDFFDFGWEDVFYQIKKMPVTDDYSLEWRGLDPEKIVEILVDRHDFSKERVDSTLDKLKRELKENAQKGLDDFF